MPQSRQQQPYMRLTGFIGSLLLTAVLLGCNATTAPQDFPNSSFPARQGYTCCNLFLNVDYISDGNFSQYTLIPAGSPIVLTGWGTNRVKVSIDGQPIRLGHDYGRQYETLQKFVEKIIVKENPQTRLAQYPADVQSAIRQGKVMPGMTREQVLMAVGYPLPSETSSLYNPTWRHYYSMTGNYDVTFNTEGRVARIDVRPAIKPHVVYAGN